MFRHSWESIFLLHCNDGKKKQNRPINALPRFIFRGFLLFSLFRLDDLGEMRDDVTDEMKRERERETVRVYVCS